MNPEHHESLAWRVPQARAKLPKKRRRVLPVEPTRPLVRLPGQAGPPGSAPGCPGSGPGGGGGVGGGPGCRAGGDPMGPPVAQNRRMNAIKSNHPKDAMGGMMGK